MKKRFISRTFFVIALLLAPSSALGYRHFYRAGPYHSEPRADKNCLTSVDVSVLGGSATKGKNGSKTKVDTLNIYGLHNMHKLGDGVPGLNVANIDDAILINLAALPNNGDFGKLLFTGKFKHIGVNVTFTQNWCDGFFTQAVLPLNKMEVSDIAFTDQSPTTGISNINTAEWVQFKARFNDILTRHTTTKADTSKTSFGDMELHLGWTYNNETSNVLDFFDTTIKVGLTLPTGKKANRSEAFSIGSGYEHVGIPVSFDMALGLYEWVTWGSHVGGTFFLKKTAEHRMQTQADQNGFIKLGKGDAKRDLGNVWDVGTYFKADHVAGGLSLMVGYSFQSQEDTTLEPTDINKFPSAAANSDEMLKKWRMHVIHTAAEYDLSEESCDWNPKVCFFYNHPVSGKRIFNTNTFGGSAGVNFTWKW